MRSRLEARWATFFDQLGIEYSYESQGYDLGDRGWYLPDFWLWEHEAFVEIKPRGKFVFDEKCQAIADGGYDIVYVSGEPWPGDYKAAYYGGRDGFCSGSDPLEFATGRRQEEELWLHNKSMSICLKSFGDDGGKNPVTDSDKLKVAYQMARGARF